MTSAPPNTSFSLPAGRSSPKCWTDEVDSFPLPIFRISTTASCCSIERESQSLRTPSKWPTQADVGISPSFFQLGNAEYDPDCDRPAVRRLLPILSQLAAFPVEADACLMSQADFRPRRVSSIERDAPNRNCSVRSPHYGIDQRNASDTVSSSSLVGSSKKLVQGSQDQPAPVAPAAPAAPVQSSIDEGNQPQ